MHRNLLIFFGWMSVLIALIGAVLPLVPAFPFVIAATYCFAKSSKKLHDWFIETKLYKYNIETYVEGRKLRIQTKLLIILGVSFTSLYGFYAGIHFGIEMMKYLMPLIWVTNVIYFGFMVKTVKE